MTMEPEMDAARLLAAIVESSSDAIVGKTLDGTVLSWNAGAERIFGYSSGEMVGNSVRLLVPDSRLIEEDALAVSIANGEQVPPFETVRCRKDGSEVHVAITMSPVYDMSGTVVAISKIARDITEARQTKQALEDSEIRFRLMADNISQLAWIAGPDGGLTWYNRRWYDYTGSTFAEMQGWGWRNVHHPDYAARVEAKYRACITAETPWEDTFPLRGYDQRYRWFLSRAQPLRAMDGRVLCWFGTNTDITEQREAERRIELLMLEVNHRSKNMLAMIQSLARRSLNQTGRSNADFVARLEQRIASLAASQDLLVRRSWTNVPLAEVVDVQLAFLGDGLAQISVAGADVLLTPAAAETIGMVLHELAINALKYGALSTGAGRVAIGWEQLAPASPAEAGGLTMSWRESGGPTVSPPQQRGFGSRLIADVPRGKLGAQVAIDYAPSGVVWTMQAQPAGVLA